MSIIDEIKALKAKLKDPKLSYKEGIKAEDRLNDLLGSSEFVKELAEYYKPKVKSLKITLEFTKDDVMGMLNDYISDDICSVVDDDGKLIYQDPNELLLKQGVVEELMESEPLDSFNCKVEWK